MDSTLAILFGIWVVMEVIDNIKKYKKEKEQKYVEETIKEILF